MNDENVLSKFFAMAEKNPDAIVEAGFKGEFIHLSRFMARLNFVKSLNSIELVGFSNDTTNGYCQLTRVAFLVSAMEMYGNLIKKHRNQADLFSCVSNIFSNEKGKEIAEEISDLFFDVALLHELSERSNFSTTNEIKRVIKNGKGNVFFIAVGIRHLLFHGILTPNVNGSSPHHVSIMAKNICEFIIETVEQDLNKRIEKYFNKNKGI